MRMSPERPPSHDSGGGGVGVGVISGLNNGGTNTITQILEPQNMVLTTIPTETSHIITTQQSGQQQQHRIITSQQQQHQQSLQTQQIIVNGNSCATIHNNNNNNSQNATVTGIHQHRLKTFTAAASPINSSTSPKYVVFHQNGTSQYATVSTEPPSTTTYITTAQPSAIGQQSSNGVGNIVVLATEQIVEPIVGANHLRHGTNNSGNDEDLTSLSWLHDKNLINNIVSYPATNTNNNSNNKSATASPIRQSNNNNANGTLSPTSDFLEDSCVSEDNASSANSSSDQGISIHSSDFSPTTSINNGFGGGVHHHIHNQQQQNGYTQVHHIQYTNSTPNNNNNNNSTSKNLNHILSPPTSSSFSTSSQQQQDVIINGSIAPAGSTTTLHVGPSGTTTVVEYKASSNFIPSRQFSQQVPSSSSSQKIPLPQQNTIIVQNTNQTPNSTTSASISNSTSTLPSTPTATTTTTATTTSTTTTTTTTYHQQHFHKKYLREQMNGLENNNSDNNNQGVIATTSNNNQIPPITNSSNEQTTIITNQSTNVNEDNHFNKSLAKSLSTTVSYSTINGQDDLAKEGINFENQNGGSSSTMSKPSKQTSSSPKQKHITNLSYDPQVNTHNKPPYSFSSLIFMAIEDSPHKALPVKEIYAWIVQHFPYFKTAPTGWKNSVRHNLSLNKSFLKVEKAPNMGKGSLWRVEESQRQNLIQALTRSPFYPCAAVDKISPSLKSPGSTPQQRNANSSSAENSETSAKNLDSKLFPKLSKIFKELANKTNCKPVSGNEGAIEQSEYRDQHMVATGEAATAGVNDGIVPTFENIERLARDCGADNIDDVNAAAAMLALKHGPKVFSETFQNGSPVITSSPSEDHTYSAGNGGTSTGNNSNNTSENNSNCNSSDGAYDSREGSPIHPSLHHHHQQPPPQQFQHYQHHHITPQELEEQKRHAEGVDAILFFASSAASSTAALSSAASSSVASSSAASSPVKRPSSTSPGEEEQILLYNDNRSNLRLPGTSSATSEDDTPFMMITSNQRQQAPFNAEGYYNLLSPTPAKKLKTSRNIRTKIKRKATWIR